MRVPPAFYGVFLFLAANLLSGCGGNGAYFDETSCPFVVDPSHIQGATMRCGILYTPEVHGDATRFIQVPILVFKATESSLPPLVNLSGGPGQSWADLGLESITAADTNRLRMDLVFIEQRGTGLSRPRLDCPAQGASESDKAYIARCVSQLEAQSINLAAYNVAEMADDVATMQKVLGYDRITLDGVSYGTAWGLQILRAHGNIVSSAILDSVVAPTIPTFSASASATDSAFSAAFAACSKSSACYTSYGDIEAKMIAALDSLSQKPLTIAGTIFAYDDQAFFSDARTVLAFEPALLPRMINAVSVAIASSSGLLLFDSDLNGILGAGSQAVSSFAFGQYMSVVCSDNQFVAARSVQSDLARVRSAFAPYLDESGLLNACAKWPYRQRDSSSFNAVTSSVTTLLLSGSFDPLTSPDWASEAAQTLANGYWVEFPGLGHDESASTDPCPKAIWAAFVKSPGQPDTRCVNTMTISFADPAPLRDVILASQRSTMLPQQKLSPMMRLWARHTLHAQLENRAMRRRLEMNIRQLARVERPR